MRLATIDLDKLLFTNVTGSTLSWVNEIDISNAIVTIYSNAISRQAVLNTLDNMDKALDVDRTVERYKELLKECFENLTALNLVSEWIPVSERLPDKTGWYLVTFKTYGGGYAVCELSYRKAGNYWSGRDVRRKALENDEIVAWMPKPQAYTESEVEK